MLGTLMGLVTVVSEIASKRTTKIRNIVNHLIDGSEEKIRNKS
jgi:intracellular sulfur oxidation DsrE/DsrF family protein